MKRTAALLLLLASSLAVDAAQMFIAPTLLPDGSPSADSLDVKDADGYGASPDKPYATLDYAAKQAAPGDELIAMDGTYLNEGYGDGDIWKKGQTVWMKDLRGEAGNPIVVRGESPERNAVFKGDAANIFQCRSCAWVIIKDIKVEGEVLNIDLQEATDNRFMYRLKDDDSGEVFQRLDPSWTPEEIDAWFEAGNKLEKVKTERPPYYNTVGLLIHSSWHVSVENCEVAYVPGTGLRAQSCDYITFKNNIVHDCSRRASTGTNGIVCNKGLNSISGEYVEDSGYRFVMWGNTIYNNYNEVYSWVDTKDYVHPYIDEGKGMSMEQINNDDWVTGKILMANNVAYNNGLSGINSNNSDRIHMFHNTAYQNTFSGAGPNTGVSCNDSKECQIKNNIAISINDFRGRAINSRFQDVSEVDITDNQYIGTLSKKMPDGVGTEFKNVEDFQFANVDANDFRLQDGSVAIDACPNDVLAGITVPGIDNAYSDFAGNDRNAPGDCGAFQFTGSRATGGLDLGTGSAEEGTIFESDIAWDPISGAANPGCGVSAVAVMAGALLLLA